MSSNDDQPVIPLKRFEVHLNTEPRQLFTVECDDFRDTGNYWEFTVRGSAVAVFPAGSVLAAVQTGPAVEAKA